jgi:hypothetical protein
MPFSLADFSLAGRFEFVNEKVPWSGVIGSHIVGAEISTSSHSTSEGTTIFPFAVLLIFENGRSLVLSAANYVPGEDRAIPEGDRSSILELLSWLPR